jgi:DNA repair photolyase
MKRRGNQKDVRFDESELKTDLGHGNFIFVGSSCDMFAEDIPWEWIEATLDRCAYIDFHNKYLFQTKNPGRIEGNINDLPNNSVVCTTIESNRFIESIMKGSPPLKDRAFAMNEIAHHHIKTYVTVEPIMDFDLKELSYLIETCLPEQVNIGADSGNHKLPEPPPEKIRELIDELEVFTTVKQKKNLKRLL